MGVTALMAASSPPTPRITGASAPRICVRVRAQPGLDRARADRVHGDAARRVADRELAGEPDHAVLGRHVGGAAAVADQPRHRGQVDDAAAPERQHLRERALAAEERAGEIDGDDPATARATSRGLEVAVQDAGGVDHDPERPELAHRLGDRTIDVIPDADVRRDERGFAPAAADLFGDRLAAVGQQVHDGHGRAGRRECQRDRPADPGPSSGHDGTARNETHRGNSSSAAPMMVSASRMRL